MKEEDEKVEKRVGSITLIQYSISRRDEIEKRSEQKYPLELVAKRISFSRFSSLFYFSSPYHSLILPLLGHHVRFLDGGVPLIQGSSLLSMVVLVILENASVENRVS